MKKILGLILALSLVAQTAIPFNIAAADLTPDGATVLEVGDYLYFGEYNGSPVKYLVVAADDADGDGNDELLLITDKIIMRKNYSVDNYAIWSESTLRTYLNSSDKEVNYPEGKAPDENWVNNFVKDLSADLQKDQYAWDNEAGFLTNLSAFERNQIVPVTHKSVVHADDLARIGEGNWGGTEKHNWHGDNSSSAWWGVWSNSSEKWPHAYTNYDGGTDKNGVEHGVAYHIFTKDYCFIPSIKDVHDYSIAINLPGNSETAAYSNNAKAYSTGTGGYTWLRDASAADNSQKKMFAKYYGGNNIHSAHNSNFLQGIRPMFFIKANTPVKGSGTTDSPYVVAEALELSASVSGTTLSFTVTNNTGVSQSGVVATAVAFAYADGKETPVYIDSKNLTLSAGANNDSFTVPAEYDVVKVFITDASGKDVGVAPVVIGEEETDEISYAEIDGADIYLDEPSVSGKSVTITGATPADRFSYINIALVKENGGGIAYKNQIIADEDGKFAVSFNVENLFGVSAEDADKIGGWYTLTVSSSEAGSAEKRVGLSDESVMLDVVDSFNDADSELIAGILSNDEAYLPEYSALPKDDMILSDIDTDDIAALSEYICDNLPEDDYTKENFAAEFNKVAAAFLLINTEDIADKYKFIENKKYMEILGTESFTKKTYYKDLKDAETDVFANLSVNVADDILENAILRLANDAESPEALMEIVEAEYAEIGVTLDSDYDKIKKYPEVLQDMYFGMMGAFSNYADIVSAFNSAKTSALDDIPTGTTQKPIGSIMGGGGGGNRVITVADPKKDKEEVTEDKTEENTQTEAMPFNDIADLSYGIDAINRLYEDGVISGDGTGAFRPYDTVLREEFSKMLTLAFEIKAEGEMAFADVSPEEWYYPHIKNLYGAGIIKGTSETTFGIGQPLTRQDLAVMLYRYLGVEPKASEEKFIDDESVADYAKEAVYTLSYIGIINGYEDGSFYPLNLATRQETAQLIWKTSNYIEYGSQSFIPGSTENQKPECYDFLELLGVTLDTEKSFDDEITKSELVYLIMRGTNMGAASGNAELIFRDVKADFWAYGEITAAAKMGVVKGYTDDAFGINDSVASEDAAIMAMRAVGFSDGLEPAQLRANFSGIYNDMLKNIGNKERMSIRDGYNLVYNMLNSKYPKLNIIGIDDVIRSIDDSLFMESAFDVYKYTGRVEANEYTSVGISGGVLSKGKVQIDGTVYSTDVATADYIGLTVEYFVQGDDNDKKIIYISLDENDLDEIKITDEELIGVKKDGNNILIEYEPYSSGKSRNISFPLNSVVIYNGTVTGFKAGYINALIDGGQCGSVTIIEDGDNKIVRIDAYVTERIKNISSYNSEIIFESGTVISFKETAEEKFAAFYRNGEECAPADLKKDDIALVKKSIDGNVTIVEADDYYIEGTITAYTKDKYIKINNVPYDESNYFAKNVTVKIGEKARFYFDIFGKVAYMDSEEVTYDESYGFLATIASNNDLDGTCTILIYNMSGEMEELSTPEYIKFNGTKTRAVKLAEGFADGTITNTIVYYSKNSDGEVVSFGTPQSDSNILSLDIPSQNRRYLTPFFANGTAETDLPLFYLDNDTILITAPATTADKADFRNENNYNVATAKSYFKDYRQFVVEAYNLNDFNVAEIIVLRDSATTDSEPAGTSQMIVTNIAETIGEDGYEQLVIEGMSGSGEISVALKEDEYGYYTNASGQQVAIKRGDIIKYALNNRGICNFTKYVGNIYNIDRTGSYSGKTNSQEFLASGTVRDAEGSYLKIAFGDGIETVLYGLNTISAIICDSASDKIFIGSVDDIQRGDFVYTRSGYSYLKEIFVIK